MTKEFRAGDKMYQVARFSSILGGHWTLTDNWSFKQRLFYMTYGFIIRCNLYIITVQNLIQTGSYFVEKDFAKGINHLSFILLYFMFNCKVVYYNNSTKAELLIKESRETANANTEIYLRAAKSSILYCHYLNTLVMISTFICGCCFLFVNAQVWQQEYMEDVPWHGWYPFETNLKEGNLFSIFEIVRIFLAGIIANTSTQVIFNSIIIDCVGKLRILQYKVTNFHVDDKADDGLLNEDEAYARLKEIVKEHKRIIKYVTKLNDSVKYLLFAEYNSASLMFAIFLVEAIQGKDLVYNSSAIILLCGELMLMCWNVNEIEVHSTKIVDAIYQSKWYMYSKRIGMMTQMVMIRSARPLSLTIGPFSALTANSGVEVMKVAYSYITLITGTNNRNNRPN